MSEKQHHTPWLVEFGDDEEEGCVFVVSKSTECPETTVWAGDANNADDVATAHLISAAHELLGVIERVEWVYSGFICTICGRMRVDGHAPDCKLNAALKKARGE